MQIDEKEILIKSAERGNISTFLVRHPKSIVVGPNAPLPFTIAFIKMPINRDEFDSIMKYFNIKEPTKIPYEEKRKTEELMDELRKIAWLSLNSVICAYRNEVGDYFNGEVLEEVSLELFERFLAISLLDDKNVIPLTVQQVIRELKIRDIQERQLQRMEKKANLVFLAKTDVTYGDELFLAEQVKDNAKIHYYQEKYRQVVLDCATSIEVALTWLLKRKMRRNGEKENAINKVLSDNWSFHKRGENLLKKLFHVDLEAYWPDLWHQILYRNKNQTREEWEKSWGIYPLRNKVIHEGLPIKQRQSAWRLIDGADRYFKFIFDLDIADSIQSSKGQQVIKLLEIWKSTLKDEQVSYLDEIRNKGIVSLFELYSKWVFRNGDPRSWDELKRRDIDSLLLRSENVGIIRVSREKTPITLKQTRIALSNLKDITIKYVI